MRLKKCCTTVLIRVLFTTYCRIAGGVRSCEDEVMYPLSHLVRVSIPNYLAGLPIPDSFGGWFRLGVKDWLALVPFTAAVAGFSYVSYRTVSLAFFVKRPINPGIRKDTNKVVDFIEVEDIAEKVSLCRCWLSKKFPYCDGTHNTHNEETGDNVGPVVVKHK